jgi:2-oxoglutarate dehydrogenase E2 component (dihydrolipoamide succinyltransferase)
MSTIEVRVPQLPESIADATLVAWRKQPGESVSRDENLVDLETDKVVLEVPAPAAGVLRELKVENGATVTGGQLLAIIEEGAAATPSPAKTGEVSREAKAQGDKLAPSVRRLNTSSNRRPSRAPAATGASPRVTC